MTLYSTCMYSIYIHVYIIDVDQLIDRARNSSVKYPEYLDHLRVEYICTVQEPYKYT